GASWMQGHDIIFDLEDRRLGWAEADCPQYVERPDPVQGAMPPWMDSTSPSPHHSFMPTLAPAIPAEQVESITKAPPPPASTGFVPLGSSPLSDAGVAAVVVVAGVLILAACCVMCYGWRSRKRGGVYQLGGLLSCHRSFNA
ncbi:hypothetical protein FOZ63_023226, partial [Perkinsus olseni]